MTKQAAAEVQVALYLGLMSLIGLFLAAAAPQGLLVFLTSVVVGLVVLVVLLGRSPP